MKKIIFIIALTLSSFQLFAQEGYIGEIRMFAGSFAPRGWLFCDGALLPINQDQALFEILGTTYGGNGTQTFALPDLNGRVAIMPGQGPGLTSYALGQKGGSETTKLTVSQLPTHSHTITVAQPVLADEGTSNDPTSLYTAASGKNSFASTQSGHSAASLATASNTGTGQTINNMQPYLGVKFIICVEGIYPSRN